MKRPLRRRRKSATQAAVLKAALAKARKWCADNQLDIATCIGCKHRSEDGYGKRRRLCVKFQVLRKQEPDDKAHVVPRMLRVRYKGRNYHVKTDVVEVGIPGLQAYPVIESFINKLPHDLGCPACVLQVPGGAAKVLITAGHVFSNGALASGATYTATANGEAVGDLWTEVSNQLLNGALIDFAAINLNNYPNSIQQAPWTGLDAYFPDDQTGTYPDGYPGSGPLQAGISGQHTPQTLVQLDSVRTVPLTVDNGQLVLAPPIYHYRFNGPATQPGDSGAPVVLYDENNQAWSNTLLGIHIAGYTDSQGINWGWATPMQRVIEVIQARSGFVYNVVPA